MTVKGVESRLEKKLFVFLKEKGFLNVNRGQFEKEHRNGTTFNIGFNVKGYPPNDFSIQTIFGIKMEGIDKYWMKYLNIIGNDRNPHPHFISFMITEFSPGLEQKYHLSFDGKPITSFGEGRESIKSEEDISRYIEKFKSDYQELVFPFFNKAISIEWIDKKLNTNYLNFKLNFFNSTGLVYRKLIVAKLANNPDFEEMYQAFRVRWTGWFDKFNGKDIERLEKYIEVLDIVYEDLK